KRSTWRRNRFVMPITLWATSPGASTPTRCSATSFPASVSANRRRGPTVTGVDKPGRVSRPRHTCGIALQGEYTSMKDNRTSAWRGAPRLALVAALAVALAACGKDEAPAPAPGAAEGASPAAATTAATAAQQVEAQADALAALGVDELRERGRAAYAESRLYAPAGDNAL